MGSDARSSWDRLVSVLRDFFEDDELVVDATTTAADVDGWDSVATVELMVTIEREFGIRFRTGEMARLENVGQLHDRILQHLGS